MTSVGNTADSAVSDAVAVVSDGAGGNRDDASVLFRCCCRCSSYCCQRYKSWCLGLWSRVCLSSHLYSKFAQIAALTQYKTGDGAKKRDRDRVGGGGGGK